MTEPCKLTIAEAALQLRSGRLTASDLLRSCLARIEARDGTIKAWVRVYGDEAMAAAHECDRAAGRQQWLGPLHGIPVGIKDIFDVKDMETRAGTETYQPRIAQEDADAVARLRQAGAIIIGKTVTTAYAMGDPGPTRNPWHHDHTPGGSSSGSGAGVADRMCLAALGSQTVGSVIRPAAYNGVVGFKPTYGGISLQGVIPLSWQFDHVGTFSRSVADTWLLWQLLRAQPRYHWHEDPHRQLPTAPLRMPRRLWRIRDFFETEADRQIDEALDDSCQRFAAGGTQIVEQTLAVTLAELNAAHRCIMAVDAAVYHQPNYDRVGENYPPNIKELIEEGKRYQGMDYVRSLRLREAIRQRLTAALATVDAAIMPAATGPAPEGLDYTGDRSFNVLSSFCGLPVVSLPQRLSDRGLPLSLQLMGKENKDDDVLALAQWCEQRLEFNALPQ